jgi:hypothetical protein
MSDKDNYEKYEDRKQRLAEEKTLAPYEKKAEKFERMERKSSGSGRAMPDEQNMRYLPLKFKTGGKVSSASARADGCCIKGKTKGRIV